MKIALILNSFPEISEKFLLNHIIGLIRGGLDITVFAMHRPQDDKRHDIFYQYNVERYTSYLDIPRSMRKRIVRAPFLFLRLLFRNPRAALSALRIGRYRTVAANLKLLYFGNAFADKQFDIVHAHFGVNGLIGSYLKDCGFTSRLVTAFHGSDINSYPKRHGLDVYKTLYKTADVITSNTNFTMGKIVANGCPAEKIIIVPESLIASEYLELKRTDDRPCSILTVGRMEEKKGHRYTLEAIALLKKTWPDIKYYMAGGGSLESGLKARAEELGILENCHFLGVCTNAQVKELYTSCSVFTLPSVTASNGDMEGQGLVIQEAQFSGMPVVTTFHNGIPDGLIDGTTGFLVHERDVPALADKLGLLLSDAELRTKMGAAGREFVKDTYDIDTITTTLKKKYAEILNS